MRQLLLVFLLVTTGNLQAQLTGTWVRVLETGYETDIRQQTEIVNEDYLKLNFDDKRQLKIYASHLANGVFIPYQVQGDVLSFGAGRQFKVEEQSDQELILMDLINGKVTDQSRRHYYQRESIFLDKLSYPSDDLVIIGNDTAFMASRKLYPVFQTTNTPDFHIFIHNQIRSTYRTGENYFHASFMIRPDGSIDHVQLNHRIGKASDKRALKAILSSAGRWKVPRLNGKEVNILMTIEDLFTKQVSSATDAPLSIALNYNVENPEVYMSLFNLAIRNMLRKQPTEALEHLQLCEDRKPQDPNLHYLRYMIYQTMNNMTAADEQLKKVKKSKLRYLVK